MRPWLMQGDCLEMMKLIPDDSVPEQRALGIAAGLAWREVADYAVFYADYGFSTGMLAAIEHYRRTGFKFETRYIGRVDIAVSAVASSLHTPTGVT